MSSPGRSLLTWIGRLCLLAAPLVIFCGLFQPKAIEFLEPVICDDGLSLTMDGHNPDTPTDNRAICQSDVQLVDVTDRIVLLAGGLAVVAVCAFLLRSHITPRSLSAPQTPQHV